ncbi:MAG: flagellar biosynthetic protein FliO [Planctomycetes bacterium]|nr:flagellar biosynthetic protein FliO [Planctomycetota bacterium]
MKKPIPKWLMIPPAVALLLVLGPMSMQGNLGSTTGVAPASTTAATPPAETSAAANPSSRLPAVVPTPDFWRIGSTLIGVLLLGGLCIYGLRRMRGSAVSTRGPSLLTLRQSMRLSQRQALHAIEFDDRILVVGETERGLTLIGSGQAPGPVNDEAEVAARAAELLASVSLDDDGAVPKNMIIPRPAGGPQSSPPRQPTLPRARDGSKSLNDFRALLQKAGR